MRRLLPLVLLLSLPAPAYAGLDMPASAPDMSGYARLADLPQPASTVPGMETPAGAAGSATTYRRSDAIQPRISRSKTVTTASDGTFGITWATALPAVPTISLTWVNTTSMPITCELTADPTTTAVQGRCRQAQATTLASVTVATVSVAVGAQTVTPYAPTGPSGVSVHIIALPPSQ